MERILEKAYLIERIYQLNDTILTNQDNHIVNKLVNYLIEIRDNEDNFNFSGIIKLIDDLIFEITNYTKTLKEEMQYQFDIAQFHIYNLIKTKEIIRKNSYISLNNDNHNHDDIDLLNEKISNFNLDVIYI